jgi:hypothetical protein
MGGPPGFPAGGPNFIGRVRAKLNRRVQPQPSTQAPFGWAAARPEGIRTHPKDLKGRRVPRRWAKDRKGQRRRAASVSTEGLGANRKPSGAAPAGLARALVHRSRARCDRRPRTSALMLRLVFQ